MYSHKIWIIAPSEKFCKPDTYKLSSNETFLVIPNVPIIYGKIAKITYSFLIFDKLLTRIAVNTVYL
jgi:hypothetical protein